MARRRGRITVQHQPTGVERGMMRGMGVVHAVMGGVFVAASVTMIIPTAGLFGLPFLVGGLFFLINGIRMAVSKNDVAHRVGYDVETDLDRSIVGLMEEVPDSTQEASGPSAADPKMRLEQLRELYEQRLITAEEYEEKRKEIIKEI